MLDNINKKSFSRAFMKVEHKIKGRRHILFIIDLIAICAFACSLLFFDAGVESNLYGKLGAVAIVALFIMIPRLILNVYFMVWRYAGGGEYLSIIAGDFFGGVFYLVVKQYLLPPTLKIPFLQAFSIIAFSCLWALAIRLAYKSLYRRLKSDKANDDIHKIDVAIVGAGAVGTFLAKELLVNPTTHYKPYCFIDSDKQKKGSTISGLHVYPEEGILEALKTMPVKEIFIAIPSLTSERKAELFDFYRQSGCKIKIYDTPIVDFDKDTDSPKKAAVLREIQIEDLLSRDPISINTEKTGAYYKDKVILITGGGGSIGSEICRQVSKFSPKKIIIFDIYENNAYDIQQEMKFLYGTKLDLCVEISSVRDKRRVDEVMEKYRPDIVIHAAAHKHVPLMEHNCTEAVKNNIFGTLNVVESAEKHGVKKFIMISTDKAVNPTNVMGASKRMCEMIVQSRHGSNTEFMSVRFGNVLGSNGSVIPLFKRMIATGGPVTITDKRIIRYFMTIPEASQLVLEAGSVAKNGEIYVLDMGKPVKILKLAEDMIKLSGFVPYKDIEIKEIGLRPGEKLFEELLVKSEELDKTENEKIFIERDKGLSREDVEKKLQMLKDALEDGSSEAIKKTMKIVVPTYHSPEEVNVTAEKADEMKQVEQ